MTQHADHTARRVTEHAFADDRALIAAIASGDERALRDLYQREARWLAARLRRTLPPDAVEDVLQETFLAVWRGAARYQGSGEVGGWIWGIARRQAALWQRRNGRPMTMLDDREHRAAADGVDPAHEAIVRVELQRAFAAASAAGGASSDLVRRAFVEDQSIAEIARDLDIPPGTVKSRIHALRRTVRNALGKETAP